jgi:autotransporter strand-loop-strand O-heptosyltransferase
MKLTAHSYFGFDSGGSQHATNFFAALERKGVEVLRHNFRDPTTRVPTDGIHIFLCGVQEFASVMNASTAIKGTKIGFVAWEATEYPDHFIQALDHIDQLWVPSVWQRDCTVAQLKKMDVSMPEDYANFVRVVPEGVDGSIFHPGGILAKPPMRFMIFGRWEDRKCTEEMIANWISTFPEPDVELVISADNAFPVDEYKTTEERLEAYDLEDPRIKVVHFPPKAEYVKYLQEGHVLLNVSRGEGWGLPIIEGMACGIPVVCTGWGGNTEFCADACTVTVERMIKPFNVYGVLDCPGEWAEPDWKSYRWWLRELYDNYAKYREAALKTAVQIQTKFSWDMAAERALELLRPFGNADIVREALQTLKPVLCSNVGKANPITTAIHPEKTTAVPPDDKDKEGDDINLVAAAFHAGYEIDRSGRGNPILRKKEKSVFVVTGYPDSGERLATLEETVDQIHKMGYKVIIASAYPVPPTIYEKADYYLTGPKLVSRDIVRFLEGEWDRAHFVDYDIEVDLEVFLCKVASAKKPLCISTRVEELMSGTVLTLSNIYEMETPDWSSFEGQIERMDIVAEHRYQKGDAKTWPADMFECHFVDGPYLHISGMSSKGYRVVFGTPDNPDVYELVQKPGMWSRPKIRYYQDWTIRAEFEGKEVFRHHMDLKDKRVLICLGSKALGDTLAWIPYVAEFQKKHGCHVICSTWWREILDYPELELVAPGTAHDKLYASFEVGCFDNNLEKNVVDWRTTPLQQVAADILGIDYKPLRDNRARLKKFTGPIPAGKYVCFSEHSTMQTKYWNRPGAWQEIVDYVISLGLEMVSISKEPTSLKNVKKFNKRKIEDTIALLAGASFYIGLGHGPSWLAWTLGIPTVLISGFSEPWEEFPTPGRVINTDVCNGCFNDPDVKFDRGWDWCERKEWKGRPVVKYECTKEITPAMVKEKIDAIDAIYE